LHGEGEERALLVAADAPDESLRAGLASQLEAGFPDGPPRLQLLDRQTFATIERLIEAGILQKTGAANTLYRAPDGDRPVQDARPRRLAEARARLAESERKRRMAQVLGAGGFAGEALAPLREAVETALQALAHWEGEKADAPLPLAVIDAALVGKA